MAFVDAHQHFWQPARGDYGWMPADDPILSRPYSPEDLSPALQQLKIDKTVLVQAAPSVAETEYLLGIADATPAVAKVVGWIDFENPSEAETLTRLAAHPRFAGVRPMIQDLPDDDWMLGDDVQWAYQAIIENDLTFDCLGFPRHFANFETLLARYPTMRAVIDHCMKPQFRNHTDAAFEEWAEGISKLANGTNAYCKLSGLVTEADTDWSVEVLKPYTDHMIAAFGADRVMWGSDWPVVRLRCEYEQWFELANKLTEHLTESERQNIFCRSASEFYRL